MRKVQLRVIGSGDTVATFDLAIVKEDGTEYEAGPDDSYERFVVANALMRVYIRAGKKLAEEDVTFIMQWIYRCYVPEVLLPELLTPAAKVLVN
jgi:hypothetical protein